MTPNDKKTPRELSDRELNAVTGGAEITWLEEPGYEVKPEKQTSAWYGIDNSHDVPAPGSRFADEWLREHGEETD